MKLKGQPLESWKNWIDEELTSPHTDFLEKNPQIKYTLEAFQELLTYTLLNKK